MTSPLGGLLGRLTDSLSQWRAAGSSLQAWRDDRGTDDELRWFVAGQSMATAIEQFLAEAEEAQRARRRALNPSDTLLQALDTRHQQRLEWQTMREKVK